MKYWVILFLCLSQNSVAGLDNDESLSISLGHSLGGETSSQVLELAARVRKSVGYTIVPQISVFLGHHRLEKFDATEDTSDRNVKINGSMIGIRAGAAIPLPGRPFKNIYLLGALAFAHTSIQDDPWLGKLDDEIDSSSMHQASVGIYTSIKDILFNYTYSVSDRKYFEQSELLSVGYIF